VQERPRDVAVLLSVSVQSGEAGAGGCAGLSKVQPRMRGAGGKEIRGAGEARRTLRGICVRAADAGRVGNDTAAARMVAERGRNCERTWNETNRGRSDDGIWADGKFVCVPPGRGAAGFPGGGEGINGRLPADGGDVDDAGSV